MDTVTTSYNLNEQNPSNQIVYGYGARARLFKIPHKSRWLKTRDEMTRLPSIADGIEPAEELKLRQQAACFIQDMGDRLNHNINERREKITQLCLCAAMIHMHRFFLVHSFRKFNTKDIAAACLFLASKSEECPRKLEHIVEAWFSLKELKIQHTESSSTIDNDNMIYQAGSEYLVLLESIILQTIGFDLQVDLPHTTVIQNMNVIASGNNRLVETAYWIATDILHLTNWCIRYDVKILACVCINLACVWAAHEIPRSACTTDPWFKAKD